jgi:hypothetical protein
MGLYPSGSDEALLLDIIEQILGMRFEVACGLSR